MATGQQQSASSTGRMAVLDDIDRAIVDALLRDGRMPMRQLAQQLHVSRANVYARVQRLQVTRVITGYTVHVDPQRYGYGLSAYVYLKIRQQAWKAVRKQVAEIPEVDHAALVSGDHDIVLLVRTRDAASMRDLVLTQLQGIKGVEATRTELIFDELAMRAAMSG